MNQAARAIRKGSECFRPRARIIRAIGEDLISNEVIALVELIKNAYDADARSVTIEFRPPLLRGQGAIIVRDDGHGMSLDVFKSAWLEPATISKRKKSRSPGGRRVTGEKGLGRFAAARLADTMRLESTSKSSQGRVVASIDWGAFHQEELYLDEVQCDWEEHGVPPRTPRGTTLILTGLHDDWTDTSLRRLRGELARLVASPKSADRFEIQLLLPDEFREHAGAVQPPAVLGNPHYTLAGSMSRTGHLVGKGKVGDEHVKVDEEIRTEAGKEPCCGSFKFEFKVWDRDPDRLGTLASHLGSTVRDLRRDLDEACGVSIYRDSFRVLPYGSPTHDWLRLDMRRVQNPTMRLSNNQVVGQIHITADANRDLRDQTNREGLVDSQAFSDLKRCVVTILAELESRRYQARHRRERGETRVALFEDLDIEPIRASFKQRYPEDTEFLRFLDERALKVRSSIEQVQQVIVRYRRLATLGQLVDVILHDGRTPIASISNEYHLARRDLERAQSLDAVRTRLLGRIDGIARQTEVLSTLFRRISPFGGRKRGRPVEQPVETLVADAFAIYETRLRELGIRTVLPAGSTPVTMDAAEFQQIFVNLIDNATYWLQKVPPDQRAITVEVRRIQGEIEIIFADSGPGVPDNIRDYIFDPYFSAKPDGVGLGLTIAGETAAEYDGALELVSPRLLPGANFRIVLRKRLGSKEEAG